MALPGSRPNNRLILFIGIICAFVAFGGVLYLLKNSGTGPTKQVLVAKTPLNAGAPLTADSVTVVSLPADSVPDDAFLDATQVTGKSLVNNVRAGTVIIPALIATPGSVGGGGGTASATGKLDITPGYVALAIPVGYTYPAPPATQKLALTGGNSDLVSDGFYIQPNDHIDIVISAPQPWEGTDNFKVKYSFQDVRVIKVGDFGAPATGAPAVYIVELPRSQAEILTFLVSVNCNTPDTKAGCKQPAVLKYVLRPHCDYGDPNYAADVKTWTQLTPEELTKLKTSDAATYAKKAQILKDQCINPYPNYLPTTNPTAGFPNTVTTVPDGGATPQTLQGLFGGG